MHPAFTLPLTLLALAVEAVAGYPAPLYSAIGHPVTWMGALLGFLEGRLNVATESFALRRAKGALALALLLASTGVLAWLIQRIMPGGILGMLVLAVLCSTLLAQTSLYEHVQNVADAFEPDDPDESIEEYNRSFPFRLEEARKAAGMIVGRNVDVLDEAGVSRAAVESLAENFSDGIVAPAFWMALGGLPGAALYKAANTADSMIGHRTDRYSAFGWAAARVDDLINLPASRIAALCIIIAAAMRPDASAREAVRAVWRDAGKHRSPNAGWPEAAMAGALGLKLAGARVYGDTIVPDATMGDGRRALTAADIFRALRLYGWACTVLWLIVAAGIAVVWWIG